MEDAETLSPSPTPGAEPPPETSMLSLVCKSSCLVATGHWPAADVVGLFKFYPREREGACISTCPVGLLLW